MLFKRLNLSLPLSALAAALLLNAACDSAPEATQPETTQPAPQEAPKPAEQAANDTQKANENVQSSAAKMRDQFQQEANAAINLENAESKLAEIEKELNADLAELENAPTPNTVN